MKEGCRGRSGRSGSLPLREGPRSSVGNPYRSRGPALESKSALGDGRSLNRTLPALDNVLPLSLTVPSRTLGLTGGILGVVAWA